MARVRHGTTARALIDAALAPTTQQAYHRIHQHLAAFLHRTSVTALFPVSVSELTLYLGARFDEGCTASTLSRTVSAIAYGHKISGLPDPSGAFHVKQLLAGARRLRSGQDRRLALSLQDLERLCFALQYLPIFPVDRAAFRAMFTLAFFALLRPGEIAVGCNRAHTLRRQHVTQRHDLLHVTIPSSKTSTSPFLVQLAARSDISVCPVAAMRSYLELRAPGPGDQELFVNGRGQPLTCKDLTNALRRSGRLVGLDESRLTGHCLRISGASHGATLGMSETQLGQLGRWSSSAMWKYLRRPMSLLQLTPSLPS